MTGIIIKTRDKCIVEYETGSVPFRMSMPVHPDDVTRVTPGQHVHFDPVDEFTHPELFGHVGWGDSVICAKIIN